MHLFTYAGRLEAVAADDYVVTFDDIPEALTGGSSAAKAWANAPEALSVAIEGYLKAGRALPGRRPAGEGERDVPVELAVAARVLLIEAMAEQKLSGRELGRRMDRNEAVIRRILSGRGASLDLTLDALRAAGVHPGLAA